jgi:outer membrane receptor protein involved in Fe transport
MRYRGKIGAFVLTFVMPTAISAQTTQVATLATNTAATVGGKDYAQISLEELLNKDVAVAGTKTRVDIAKSPVSVTVITPEDIRRSGAMTLGEVLRTVPGLDVLESFPNYISVSARGTSESFVNNMLVVIDGRRFETLLAGVPFLDEVPFRMEDVKRIEVVKGPVGAVYGTNALAGVISITTYGASEKPGSFVSVTGGNRSALDTTFRQSGKIGDSRWAYKFTGGYSYSGTWGTLDSGNTLPPIALRKGAGVLLLERRFSDESALEIEGGFVKGDLASLTIVTNQTQYFTAPHFRTGYSRPDFHAVLTVSPQSLELRERVPPIQPLTDKWSEATSLSLDRTWRPAESSTVTVGGNVRHERSNSSNLGGVAHSHVVGGVFVQDEQSLISGRLALFGAVGVSHHPEISTQVDGNVALLATPVIDHTLRLSFGRAHRDPSFGENFINFRRKFGPNDGLQAPNLALSPESIQSYEAGYHGRFAIGQARLQFFAEGYKERLKDLIALVTSNIAKGTLPDFPSAVVLQQFRNTESRDGKGFEVGTELSGKTGRLAFQYSYQRFTDVKTGKELVADVPRHKFSSGLGLRKGNVELDLWVHTVSKTLEKGYVLVNPRLGVTLGRNWMLSAQAFNAFNDRHIETVNGRGIKGESIGRLVTANVTYSSR